MKKTILTLIAIIVTVSSLVSCGAPKEMDIKATVDSIYMSDMHGEDDWLAEVDKAVLESVYGMDFTNIEEVYGKAPTMNVQATAIIAVKAKDGQLEDAKAQLEKYRVAIVNNFEQYLEDQLEIAKNGIIVENGNYVFLILSEDADKVVESLKKLF